MNRGFEWIRELKRKTGRNIPELIALSRQRDPYFCGTTDDWKRARWFASAWKKLNYTGRHDIHLRRMHYAVEARKLKNVNGKPYKLTAEDWEDLQDCSRAARYLGLIKPDWLEDHRNGEPEYLAVWDPTALTPSLDRSLLFWFLPQLHANVSAQKLEIEAPSVSGYRENDFLDRRYLCEVWIEKSTQNDVLLPVCRDLQVTLVTGVGYQSITNAVRLLQRARSLNKDARIFYISDNDDAGHWMPAAVARQLEFWREEYAPNVNVKLRKLAITGGQVNRYGLPRDENNRVELDCLESYHPGELARMVRETINSYIDESIPDRLYDAEELAKQLATGTQWRECILPYERRAAALEKQLQQVARPFEKEAARLRQRFEKAMLQFRKPLRHLSLEVQDAINGFFVELPERPMPEEAQEDPDEWLYDSARDYLEQLQRYKWHKDDRG